MPNLRQRKPRVSKLNAKAAAWIQSDDAKRFFERGNYPLYSGPISKLPGVKPWWNPLHAVWLNYTKGEALPAPGPADDDALEFVLALHDEYKRLHTQ